MSMFDGENNTAKNFKKFYDAIYPYLNASPTMGYTPVGSVIAMMSINAPQNYLKCDGTAYSIAAYPELANHFEKEFGSKNFFGGDGTTTFAVPDLRGEFLRGTGTNSHTNQGSGANVGVHQDGTVQPSVLTSGNNIFIRRTTDTDMPGNQDFTLGSVTWTRANSDDTGSFVNSGDGMFTSRPTNTSVLYCIATKDIYVDARFDYSLTEKVVGTWIDGKPIYQKTLSFTWPTNSGATQQLIQDIDNLIFMDGFIDDGNGHWCNRVNSYQAPTSFLFLNFNYDSKLFYFAHGIDIGQNGKNCKMTLQYTKTTD